MLGDLNCTMDKIDRNGENKTQIRKTQIRPIRTNMLQLRPVKAHRG